MAFRFLLTVAFVALLASCDDENDDEIPYEDCTNGQDDDGDGQTDCDDSECRSMAGCRRDAAIPDASDDADVPDTGEDADIPDASGDADVPDASSDADVPDASGDADVPDAGDGGDPDASDAAGDAAVMCTSEQLTCDGMCFDPATDPGHCGDCDTECVNGRTCSGEVCGCFPPASTMCGTGCVNTANDPLHCGACDNACTAGTPVCSGGICVAACNTLSDETLCDGTCVTLGNDPRHCGMCDHACAASEVCEGGLCTPRATIGAVGCADGARDHFSDLETFPAIAACSGGWDGRGGMDGYTGTFPAPLRSGDEDCADAGNNGDNPRGIGCSAADLCEPGWHLCAGGEVQPRTGGMGCDADSWPAGSFYAAAIGSSGCRNCALETGTATGTCTNVNCVAGCQANPALTNDIFGCGSTLAVSATVCDVNMTGNDLCGALSSGGGWDCGGDGVRESVNAVFDPAASTAEGGVLCCRDI